MILFTFIFGFSGACKKKNENGATSKPKSVWNDTKKTERTSTERTAQALVKQTMVLGAVLVELDDTAQQYGLRAQVLSKALGRSLLSSGWIVGREGDVPEGTWARPVEATLQLGCDVSEAVKGKDGSLVQTFEMSLQFLSPDGSLSPSVAVLTQVPLTLADNKGVQNQILTLTMANVQIVSDDLASRERLRLSSHAELLSVLSLKVSDPSLHRWAIQLVGERRLEESVSLLSLLLQHENSDVSDAAFTALVLIGGPNAVEALAQNIDFQDHEGMRALLEAMSHIGGEDAQEFLKFVATGHPNDDIQDRARAVLKELESR